MKKSVDILGLPVISITEGRELGMSKTLLIDAPNRIVAAITIEDEDWYRGVKLIPYDNVIAVGDDAVTINNSENILTLDAAGDFETLLDDNIRVIGTKAITRTGVIQGNITEIFIGEDGSIEKCEVTTPEGSTSEVTADQVAIFGKEVTVISPEGDAGKKSDTASAPAAPAVTAPAAAEPAAAEPVEETAPAEETPAEEPAAPEETAAPEAPAEEPAPAAEEPAPEAPAEDEAKDAERANEDRHRRFLLGKKATRTIKMDNGVVIVEAGADITEEVLQKAKLGNKFIELSMSAQ
ncbi:PRC-barrel domain-containing protein [Selenomonas sp. oral taxon 478]|uniref:PRC-barrel domain-containing protein n=1 Tax=Selenomonas sp. oral taxon 478 TaxID=712538 RepID=UPI000679FB52|nr:PRC-barrel domain-containing protein [Selenomonas sp. oral taxon 478]AKT53845.1 photosystem reaction center subunit H [Selenomonas sp. oral taxon 478]